MGRVKAGSVLLVVVEIEIRPGEIGKLRAETRRANDIALARFELEIHQRLEQGKGVSAKEMIDLMTELFREGYGDEIQIDHERVGITWAQFGHLYSDYYVHQYATGISAAHALADKVLNGDEGAAQRYLEALSAGGSLYPIDTLQHAGIDMRTPEAVEATFGVLAQMVDRLEALAK